MRSSVETVTSIERASDLHLPRILVNSKIIYFMLEQYAICVMDITAVMLQLIDLFFWSIL